MTPETSIKAVAIQPARPVSRWPVAPARDTLVEESRFRAVSAEPWLRVEQITSLVPGSIIHIRYSTNYYDDPVRPILRFWRGEDDFQDQVMPAPYEGSGIWTGRVPKGLTGIWISPAARAGPFDFVIEAIERVTWRFLLRKARVSPRRMFYAVSARLVGLREEADLNLRWALGSEPLATYRSWKAERRGSGIAVPRADWSQGPPITLVIQIDEASAVDATCRSIVRQSYPHWRVVFQGPAPAGDAHASRQTWLRDPRFGDAWTESAEASRLICHLTAGDELEPHALGCFVEHFACHPEQTIVYADDILVDADGGELPRFKPNWSPTLEKYGPYVGRAVLFRENLDSGWRYAGTDRPDDLLRGLLEQSPLGRVGHIRRALFRFPDRSGARPVPQTTQDINIAVASGSRVTLIIPTRDRADLLEPCLRSILNLTSHGDFDILVVDNDSAEPATHDLFRRFSLQYARLKVVKSPGPFNFAAICNKAVDRARGDFLVFLNNDTTIITPDWIEKLQSFAKRPDVGAVGARLLYPSRRLQHAGLVLGMGGIAGHFGAHAAPEAPGWHRRNLVPHETLAVTGACLMVEKAKFLAVNGFDAAHLPVDLNDVDLCLRLAERGWRTICDTRAELFHHESASRGGGFRLQRVYQRERTYFAQRWPNAIRDDPFFSPALSLYAYSAQLW